MPESIILPIDIVINSDENQLAASFDRFGRQLQDFNKTLANVGSEQVQSRGMGLLPSILDGLSRRKPASAASTIVPRRPNRPNRRGPTIPVRTGLPQRSPGYSSSSYDPNPNIPDVFSEDSIRELNDSFASPVVNNSSFSDVRKSVFVNAQSLTNTGGL